MNQNKKLFSMDLRKTIENYLNFGREIDDLLNANGRKKEQISLHYPYIPVSVPELEYIVKDIIGHQYTGKFIDAGCGIPVIPKLFRTLGFHSFGIELYNYPHLGTHVYRQDMLTFDFKDFDVIYSYHPVTCPKLMNKILLRIKKTMKKGAVLYFVSTRQTPLPGLGYIMPHLEHRIFKYIKK